MTKTMIEIRHANGRDVHEGDMAVFHNQSVQLISNDEEVAKEPVNRVGEIVSDGGMTVHMDGGSEFDAERIAQTRSGWLEIDTEDGKQTFTCKDVRYAEV